MGSPKALLRLRTGEGLLERTVRVVEAAGLHPVVVGHPMDVSSLGALDARARLADAVVGAGPLGGLVALLRAANGEHVIALACDLPGLHAEPLRHLARAPAGAPVLAPRRDGRWEPLAARYDAKQVLDAAVARLDAQLLGLQGLLDAVGACTFEVGREAREQAWLEDWDTPEDRARSEEGSVTP